MKTFKQSIKRYIRNNPPPSGRMLEKTECPFLTGIEAETKAGFPHEYTAQLIMLGGCVMVRAGEPMRTDIPHPMGFKGPDTKTKTSGKQQASALGRGLIHRDQSTFGKSGSEKLPDDATYVQLDCSLADIIAHLDDYTDFRFENNILAFRPLNIDRTRTDDPNYNHVSRDIVYQIDMNVTPTLRQRIHETQEQENKPYEISEIGRILPDALLEAAFHATEQTRPLLHAEREAQKNSAPSSHYGHGLLLKNVSKSPFDIRYPLSYSSLYTQGKVCADEVKTDTDGAIVTGDADGFDDVFPSDLHPKFNRLYHMIPIPSDPAEMPAYVQKLHDLKDAVIELINETYDPENFPKLNMEQVHDYFNSDLFKDYIRQAGYVRPYALLRSNLVNMGLDAATQGFGNIHQHGVEADNPTPCDISNATILATWNGVIFYLEGEEQIADFYLQDGFLEQFQFATISPNWDMNIWRQVLEKQRSILNSQKMQLAAMGYEPEQFNTDAWNKCQQLNAPVKKRRPSQTQHDLSSLHLSDRSRASSRRGSLVLPTISSLSSDEEDPLRQSQPSEDGNIKPIVAHKKPRRSSCSSTIARNSILSTAIDDSEKVDNQLVGEKNQNKLFKSSK